MGACASNTVTEAADLPVLRHELADGTVQSMARIHFCVDTDGSVTDMKRLSSTGDDDADRTVWDTVAAWSFGPFVHDGKPMKACSVVKFELTFAPDGSPPGIVGGKPALGASE